MAILGNFIKTAIELTDKLLPEPNAVEAQQQVLRKLLTTAKDTAFGQQYKFNGILKSVNLPLSYAQHVPFHDYQKIYDEWWYQLLEGEQDITWPGRPNYFALSSGTTGSTSKRIPVTDEMLAAIRNTGIQQVTSLANFDLPPEFFEKEIMMLGSSTDLQNQGNYLEGEISGISASNIPFWFKGYYKPGDEIAQIDDWDTRVQKIAERAETWDIGALSGIPSWIELMLKKVIDYHGLKNIHEIWPNLMVYTPGGVAFEPYRKSFEKLLAHPLIYLDTYLASEGFLAFQNRPDTNAMSLVVDNGIYFEFVPFEEKNLTEEGNVREDAEVLTLAEVEEGVDYVLIITTVAGAWRYMIGDTIMFTDKGRHEIRITGRTKHFLNVVGSQLSVHKMNDAIQKLEEHFDVTIPEFTVAAVRRNADQEYIHRWYLGSDETIDERKATQLLDEVLSNMNKNYSVARSKALKGVEVKVVPTDIFYNWSERSKKKGGQVKTSRVMSEEKFAEWEEFAQENYTLTKVP
ncbi:GH3 family domain-containing protein [Tunicatimonas pelagia]|uniref:GH3 family domain-containing protein n=1 Tax=Tunicatimonas pelagia TaxID=931531 RepID=UPI0026653D09|nr:GH3 auxin-responsive promoter family protein [Tunicatimonas pelagia]WKN43173.1 GH3 auxin-responsive promoter family protein [Tunicatimonas pelagia]